MIRKITIKNPGCQFCTYYVAPVTFKKKTSNPACGKGGRRIFEKTKGSFFARRWKWVDCGYTEERNKGRLCPISR